MNDDNRPHPLDADDEDDLIGDKTFERSASVHAHQPLLKPSLIIAAVATVVLFAASVVSIVSPSASGLQQTAVNVFRISGVLLVTALLGVLFAFRIAYMRSERYRPLGLNRFFRGYSGFVLANFVAIALVWIVLVLLFLMTGSVMLLVVIPLLIFGAGVLVTMTVWHSNYLRAYAIGCLTCLVLVLFSQISTVAMMTMWGGGVNWGRRGGSMGMFTSTVLPLGLFITAVLTSGLVSAGYVVAIEATTRQQAGKRPPE